MLSHLAACCLALGTAASGQAIAPFVSARLLSGSLPPPLSPAVVGRIDEILEVTVDPTGRVTQITRLRASPLPADPLAPTVADWRFAPANDQGRVVQSRVLVAALFRPPQLYNSPTLGDPPVDLTAPSDEIPFPIVTQLPSYPPLAIANGMVLVEVLVGVNGGVRELRTVTGDAAFEQAALDAARLWSFRPAGWNGGAVEAYAYLVFGFRQPVVVPARP